MLARRGELRPDAHPTKRETLVSVAEEVAMLVRIRPPDGGERRGGHERLVYLVAVPEVEHPYPQAPRHQGRGGIHGAGARPDDQHVGRDPTLERHARSALAAASCGRAARLPRPRRRQPRTAAPSSCTACRPARSRTIL